MDELLLSKLTKWHEENEFQKIITTIEAIPENERNYDLIGHLARAYNNNDEYDRAIEQLKLIADKGQSDPLWHFRLAYAYFYSDLYAEALLEFEYAAELDPEDEHTQWFIEMCHDSLSPRKISYWLDEKKLKQIQNWK